MPVAIDSLPGILPPDVTFDSAQSRLHWKLPSTLCDDNGNIARWVLTESRDLYGNTVRYYYDRATVKNRGAEGRQLYLDSISYTGYGNTDGYYTVVFCRTPTPTFDIPISCNNGFKEITDQLLNNIYVKCGDSILTAWLFDLENTYASNYKNRLVSISKIDSASGGIRNFLLERCHCLQQDEDEDSTSIIRLIPRERYDTITIQDTIDGKLQSYLGIDTVVFYDTIVYPLRPINAIQTGYAGSTCRFTYFDFPEPNHLFGDAVENSLIGQNIRSDKVVGNNSATALGLSHSTSWNVGGAITAGVGLITSLSSFTGGGNYSYGRSFSESVMTLIDLDGDGLADKVYVDNGTMFFCKRKYYDNDSIVFAAPQPIPGANHFMIESGQCNTVGAQISLGVNGSASWSNSKSTTSVYFADVNGDGLVDIVDNGQVLFNSVVDGIPSFSLYENDNENTTVNTSASVCGGIIFDGEVNDSIKCREIWKHFKTETRKITDPDFDSFLLPYQNDEYLILVDTLPYGTAFNFHIYHRELDCTVHDESMNTEAVRVWIAYRSGTININSIVGLLEDTSAARQAARHADGISFSIQRSSYITHDDTSFLDAFNNIVFSGKLKSDVIKY